VWACERPLINIFCWGVTDDVRIHCSANDGNAVNGERGTQRWLLVVVMLSERSRGRQQGFKW